ncbi:MAG: FimB/Mfa2 family fimbrial subunit [Prevotella sp.]|nr:FimB/Mfa2 family fimbrial subunit [Prevotella sp.]
MNKLRLLILGLLATLLTGCSLEDERDDCGVTFKFRYVLNSEDRFKKDVTSMRHFLFDGNDIYMGEYVDICGYTNELKIRGLKKGNYTLVTICNATERTRLSELTPGRSLLSEFTQGISSQQQNGCYTNGDQLFYNACPFSISETDPDTWICDLSNIHCHLHVLATWDYSPSFRNNDFTMRLSEVPASYSLATDSTRRILQQFDDPALRVSTGENHVQLFPLAPQTLAAHLVSVLPFNAELEAEFVTERYTNQWVPILQVFNGETAVTGRLNLDRAFTYFGWWPDNNPAQEYYIRLVIHRDGSVDMDRWARGRVNDWIDGGTITN